MKRYAAIPLAAALWAGSAASAVEAHHAYGSFFDLCKSLTIEGRIDSVQWKDPHVFMQLALDDATAYRAEWTSPAALSRSGLRADTLKAGDRIAVTGSTWKDRALMEPATRALVSDPPPKTVSALTQVRRASDGWNWTRHGGGPPPDCSRK
jgi:hypothetical protein